MSEQRKFVVEVCGEPLTISIPEQMADLYENRAEPATDATDLTMQVS